jgi:hypothetical protein
MLPHYPLQSGRILQIAGDSLVNESAQPPNRKSTGIVFPVSAGIVALCIPEVAARRCQLSREIQAIELALLLARPV